MQNVPGGIVLLFNLPILLMVVSLASLLHCGTHHLLRAPSESIELEGVEAAGCLPDKQLDLARSALLRSMRIRMWVGIASYLIGFASWNVVEQGCETMPDGFIAIGHAVWHLGAAYGLHCLFCILIFCRSTLEARRYDGRWPFRFRTSRYAALRAWLLVFPVPEVVASQEW